jgi:hypothetical protein
VQEQCSASLVGKATAQTQEETKNAHLPREDFFVLIWRAGDASDENTPESLCGSSVCRALGMGSALSGVARKSKKHP